MSVRYRPDIDGLRAVAVVPVVLYHAGAPLFRGGFVGVDVFFVISGYLITSLILPGARQRTFSLSEFYARRVCRILPALFVMMALVTMLGWVLLAPLDLTSLGQSVLAATLMVSNLLFLRQTGYFDAPLAEMPLLHTWSLAVEEQFYVVFPLYLVLLFRFLSRRALAVTLALAVTSLLFSGWALQHSPASAFFLAPYRAWELLAGALLAMGALPAVRSSPLRESLALAGVVGIAFATFTYSESTAFPGAAALAPVLGTVLVIWAGESGETRVSRALSLAPAVSIGKISYSLYLWHFPLLALAAYVNPTGLDPPGAAAVIAASGILAMLSWRYVEQPARRRRGVFAATGPVFAAAAAGACALAAAGLAIDRADGFADRIEPAALRVLAAAQDTNPDRSDCPPTAGADERPGCLLGEPAAKMAFVLWGDSHAEMLRPAVDDAARRAGARGFFVGWGGCAPLTNVERDGVGCDAINDAILRRILTDDAIETVLLAGRWALWTEGTRYKREARPPIVLWDTTDRGLDAREVTAAGLTRTVSLLTRAGRRVWLVGPVPEIGYSVPRALFLSSVRGSHDLDIRPSRAEFDLRQGHVFELLHHLVGVLGARAIWPHEALCDEEACRVEDDQIPIYLDDNHLTLSAARSLSPVFEAVFAAP